MLIVSHFHVFLIILSPRLWSNGCKRGKHKDERNSEDGVTWTGFECKWLECGITTCKMRMSIMVPNEEDMEHEVVKCGMFIVEEMNAVKGD